jgi:hypothetical protein
LPAFFTKKFGLDVELEGFAHLVITGVALYLYYVNLCYLPDNQGYNISFKALLNNVFTSKQKIMIEILDETQGNLIAAKEWVK